MALALLFYAYISQQERSVFYRHGSILQDGACAVTECMLCGDGRHNLNAALKIMNKPSAKS